LTEAISPKRIANRLRGVVGILPQGKIAVEWGSE
jgi:hypothetical protein